MYEKLPLEVVEPRNFTANLYNLKVENPIHNRFPDNCLFLTKHRPREKRDFRRKVTSIGTK